ncbi:MAG: hypothetical protein ACRDUX_28240 [Mycobacterium sp.]
MTTSEAFRHNRIPLAEGSGAIASRPHSMGAAMQEIRDAITTNVRFNSVVQTGVPGFIPRAQ